MLPGKQGLKLWLPVKLKVKRSCLRDASRKTRIETDIFGVDLVAMREGLRDASRKTRIETPDYPIEFFRAFRV